MRIKRKTDYKAVSRQSIKRDLHPKRMRIDRIRTMENKKTSGITVQDADPAEGNSFRIATINPSCEYSRYSRFFIGRLVRLERKTGIGDSTTGWYEFVFDEDRVALNQAAGWSDGKRKYLLEKPKFK